MTSERKINSNRANAKASTGPRSTVGKCKAAQNARRHGLNIREPADPDRATKIKKLARAIAGKETGLEVQEVSQRIAEAEIDLVRIREVSHNLYRTKLPFNYTTSLHFRTKRSKEFGIKLLALTDQLLLVERYERRALSRRKFAIRELDALRSLNRAT